MKILLTGGSGTLGKEIIKISKNINLDLLVPTRLELDIENNIFCENYFLNNYIDLVIHAAAYTDVKNSEQNYIKSINTNIIGTCNIVKCCEKYNIKLIYISTDYVFDGAKGKYEPADPINPITKYAMSKAAGELAVRMYPKSLIIRTSFYGYTFPYDKAFIDQWSSKDYIDLIAPRILEESLSQKNGIVHVGSKRRSIYEIAKTRKENVLPCESKDVNLKIPRDTSFKE